MSRKFGRSQSGIYLVEALVAIAVGSMVAISLTALLGQTLQTTSATTNQLLADQVGVAVLDTMRGLDYNSVKSWNQQSFPLQLNKASGSSATGPPPHPWALGLDSNAFLWTPLSVSNSFAGTASILVTNPFKNALLVSVTVTWSDSEKLVPHTSIYQTTITYGGENYWE